jgi:hypothetical protein
LSGATRCRQRASEPAPVGSPCLGVCTHCDPISAAASHLHSRMPRLEEAQMGLTAPMQSAHAALPGTFRSSRIHAGSCCAACSVMAPPLSTLRATGEEGMGTSKGRWPSGVTEQLRARGERGKGGGRGEARGEGKERRSLAHSTSTGAGARKGGGSSRTRTRRRLLLTRRARNALGTATHYTRRNDSPAPPPSSSSSSSSLLSMHSTSSSSSAAIALTVAAWTASEMDSRHAAQSLLDSAHLSNCGTRYSREHDHARLRLPYIHRHCVLCDSAHSS